jgi:rare lipoprotein A
MRQDEGVCLVGAHAFGALAFAAGAMILSSSAAMAGPAGDRCGKAVWFDGRGLTASGERNQAGALTAAHRSLPFGTEVRVDNLGNGRSVVVRVNDRGRFTRGRIISVSRAAAEKLGMISDGVARVRLSVAGEAEPVGEPCDGDLTVASAEGDVGSDESIADPVSIAEPVSVEVPLPPEPPTISDDAMAERFEGAFQPESWEESELRKLIEALLPRYWRRGSELAPAGASAPAAVDIPWPALDGLTQVSLARVYLAELWSTELADPASARFQRMDASTALSLLTQ